jgi:hypothetical protein
MSDAANDATTPRPSPRWWRHGLVWMVIGGPAVVVVASIATFMIAAHSPDPLVAHDSYRLQVQAAAAPAQGGDKGMLPAQQGRNHAASPIPAP